MSKTGSISIICALGLFLAGYIFYSSSVIESFYTQEFKLTPWQIGIAQSCVPLGAIFGAFIAGKLTDQFGRRRVLRLNFLLLILAGLSLFVATDFLNLCLIRISNGILAGTLYPLCATYLIEMTPTKSHAKQTAVLMFLNCAAAPAGCIVTLLIANYFSDEWLWRITGSAHSIPALLCFIWLRKLPESSAWIIEKNDPAKMNYSIKDLFSPHYKKITLCLMAAWFLMDVAYYSINFFIPYILKATSIEKLIVHSNHHAIIETFIINLFFMLGALCAIFVVNKISLINLQKYGFLTASLSLTALGIYFILGHHAPLIIIALFIIFNFAINIGPDVTTYLLPAKAYPVEIRGMGHGFIAAFAKFGSFLGVLLLPQLQHHYGHEVVILLLAALLFIAYLTTIEYTTTHQDALTYETP